MVLGCKKSTLCQVDTVAELSIMIHNIARRGTDVEKIWP